MSDSVVTRITALLPMLHSDTRANLVAWDDSFLTREFNDGLREATRTSGLFVAHNDSFINLIQGVIYYMLPSDLLDVIRVALDGVALIPSSTSELEMLSESFQYDQGTPQYWYLDHGEYHQLGVYPVPNALAAGSQLDLIYHKSPCAFDEAHTSTTLDAPLILGDMLELRTLTEAYKCESDMQLPEVAQMTTQAIEQLYKPNFLELYGRDQ